jgi:hypothetical protein
MSPARRAGHAGPRGACSRRQPSTAPGRLVSRLGVAAKRQALSGSLRENPTSGEWKGRP